MNLVDPLGEEPHWLIRFFNGIGISTVETLESLWNTLTNPEEVFRSISYSVSHPKETVEALTTDIQAAVSEFGAGDT